MTQTSLDFTGEELKQYGASQSANAEKREYVEAFNKVFRSFPRGHVFTVEDIEEQLGERSRKNSPGGLILGLAHKNLIAHTGEYPKARNPKRRGGRIMEWRVI